MPIRHVIIMLAGFIAGSFFFQYENHAQGKEVTETKEEMPCAKNADVEKIMEEKGYMVLLNMTRKENNKDGIVESLWVSGTNAVITATVPNADSSCFIVNMENVTMNPNAIEAIWNAYKKQNNQKDI